jgi:multiple sugar transport system permease protein
VSTVVKSTSKREWRLYGSRRSRWVITGICVLLAVYILIPIYWMVLAASKTDTNLLNTFGFAPSGPFELFKNVSHAFSYSGGIYGHWLLNTVIYSLASGAGAAILSSIGGYAFARYEFRGRKTMFGVILASVMVPATVLAIPLYLLLSHVDLLDNAWGFILPSLVSPVGIYLMRVYSEAAVPSALLDAARVDGAGEVRIFWSIVMRLISPGAATVFLFSVVGTWNNYFLPLLLFSTSSKIPATVGLGILQTEASQGNTGSESVYTMVVAGSLILVVPLVAVFLLLQRYWRSGLTLGAVTG